MRKPFVVAAALRPGALANLPDGTALLVSRLTILAQRWGRHRSGCRRRKAGRA